MSGTAPSASCCQLIGDMAPRRALAVFLRQTFFDQRPHVGEIVKVMMPGIVRGAAADTLIRTLRKTYGASFALGCSDDEKLSDVLHKIDEHSLGGLLRDLQRGKLDDICQQAA